MAKIKKVSHKIKMIATKHTSATPHPRLAKHKESGKPSSDPSGVVMDTGSEQFNQHDQGESKRKQHDHKSDIDKKAKEAAAKKKEEEAKYKPKPPAKKKG